MNCHTEITLKIPYLAMRGDKKIKVMYSMGKEPEMYNIKPLDKDEAGYLTTVGSAEALIAKRMGLTSKEMKGTVLKALFVGDSRTIQDLIIKHNHYR